MPGAVTASKAAWEKVSEDLGHLRDYVQLVVESQVGAVDLNAIRAMAESAGMGLRKVTPRPKLVLGAAARQGPGKHGVHRALEPRARYARVGVRHGPEVQRLPRRESQGDRDLHRPARRRARSTSVTGC